MTAMNDQLDVAASTQPASAAVSGTPNGRSWPAWHKLDDEQPKPNQRVLFWYNGKVHLGKYLAKARRFYLGEILWLQASYWMPLPGAPYGEGGA